MNVVGGNAKRKKKKLDLVIWLLIQRCNSIREIGSKFASVVFYKEKKSKNKVKGTDDLCKLQA